MRICEELKQHRLDNFLSQQEMAEKLGVSMVTYNHLENGSKDLSLKTIEKISKLLNKGYGYIREHL